MINLGSKVRDVVSGFTGRAHARTEFMYGCARIHIEPMAVMKDGNLGEIEAFDEQRVEELEPAKPFIYPSTNIKLGSRIRDTVTGFAGIAHSRRVNVYGDSEFGVEPTEVRDGKLLTAYFVREQRLELIEEKAPPVTTQSSATSGGPQREFKAR